MASTAMLSPVSPVVQFALATKIASDINAGRQVASVARGFKGPLRRNLIESWCKCTTCDAYSNSPLRVLLKTGDSGDFGDTLVIAAYFCRQFKKRTGDTGDNLTGGSYALPD